LKAASKLSQKEDKRGESHAEFESRMKLELQEILSSKMQKLLEQQTEATKVTADAAKQLAQLQMNKQQVQSTSVADTAAITIGELARTLRQIEREITADAASPVKSRKSKVSNMERKSDLPPREKSPSRRLTTTTTAVSKTNSVSEESSSGGRIVSRELKTFMSKTESRIPEIMGAIEQTEASGGSVPRSIAEVIDNLTVDELSASQNISEEIAAELSERFPLPVNRQKHSSKYSSKFDDDDTDSSTVKEVSTSAASVSSSSKASVVREEDKTGDYSESGSMADESTSESRLLAPSTSTLSLFEGDSFNKFTLQMFKQHLEEESLRARHQYDLLKKKELLLIDRAKAELASVQKSKVTVASAEEKERAKRKGRAILSELKKRRGEIDMLKKGIKVAEKERKLIMQQQKKLLRDKPGGGSSSFSKEDQQPSMSRSRTVETVERSELSAAKNDLRRSTQSSKDAVWSAERQILHGIRKLEKNKRLLGDKESEFLEKTKGLERLLKQSASGADSVSSDAESSSLREELKTESDKTITTTTTTATSPSKMQNLKKIMGTTLKTPLSPKLRRRHSSADSDDSLSVSQAETVSDHSDVEIRINVLQDELQRRMMTAAKLKRQQKSKGKEKLRIKEDTLKKQIEKYDKLILETRADLEESHVVVQPQIKTPYKQVEKQPIIAPLVAVRPSPVEAAGEINSPRTTPDLDDTADSSSIHTASRDSSAAADTIISNKEEKYPDKSQLSSAVVDVRKDKAAVAAAASPTKVSEGGKTSEEEDIHSDLNYSDDFTSSNGSGAETSPSKPRSLQTPSVVQVKQPTPAKNELEEKVPSAPIVITQETIPSAPFVKTQEKLPSTPLVKAQENVSLAPVPVVKKDIDVKAQAERVANGILEDLLKDTFNACAKSKDKQATVKTDYSKQPSSPTGSSTSTSLASPRSRPQDLMLTTFDISSESDEGTKSLYNVIKKPDYCISLLFCRG
jgi:hypothetical protein